MTLDKLKIGSSGVITAVGGDGPQKVAPMGDPIEIRVRGYELTLRIEEAEKIEVEGVSA